MSKYMERPNEAFLLGAKKGLSWTNFYPAVAADARAKGKRVPRAKAPKKKRGK